MSSDAAPLPLVTPWNRFYWTSGADGVIRVEQCRSCGDIRFPPGPNCPTCQSTELDIVELSGRGTVEAYTINYQPWHPAYPPPYVIAVVVPEEDPAVRFTTNIVGCPVDDVYIGMPVKVQFEHHGDVWLPMFEPDPDTEPRVPALAEAEVPSRDLERPLRPMPPESKLDKFESKVVLSGIGMSEVGRRLGRNPLGLMVEAALAAIADAGLTVDDIDGISTYPGGEILGGHSGGGITALEEALRMRPRWFASGMEIPGQTGADRQRHAGRGRRVGSPRRVRAGRLGSRHGPTSNGAARCEATAGGAWAATWTTASRSAPSAPPTGSACRPCAT